MVRRRFVMYVAAGSLLVWGAGGALAIWTHLRQAGTVVGTVDSLSAPVLSAPTTGSQSSSSITVTWSASTTTAGAVATSYTVKRYLNGSSTGVTACGGNVTSGTACTDTVPANGQYAYDVTANYKSWTRTSAAKSGTVTVTLASAPASPTSVSLSNGGGVANAYVNSGNVSSTNWAVVLPATSVATDTVHLTISDAGAAHTVTATNAAGISGGGTRTFSGVGLGTLADGTITATAWVTNSQGTSGNATATRTKDVLAPSVQLSLTAASAAGRSLAAGFAGTSLHFDDCADLGGYRMVATVVDVTSGPQSAAFPDLGTADWTTSADTETTPANGPFTSADYLWHANNCTGNKATTPSSSFAVVTLDKAGNSVSSSFTFLADHAAPTVTGLTLNNGGPNLGKIEAADFAEVTYSEAMRPTSFCSTWTGAGTQSLTNVTATVTGADVLTVSSATCTLNVGALTLTGNYNTGSNMTFANSTVSYDPSTNRLRITLGTPSGGTAATGVAAATPSYQHSTGTQETDLVGRAISTSSVPGTSTSF